ncbi:hypothetical protein E3N88_07527 [Mikania micrantha]|uniref:Protein kinase domain-containing protein n=1 Tax=Mikania micrantha TaxID=192012 RepID=A0A5N6PSG8_9ASTR|nr:hypothetical protein E3N88_07527 [Mikania micrantha]
MTRALLIESLVPKSFWPEAVATSVYLLNRLPTKALNFKTPLDCLSKSASIPHSCTLEPRIFGCTAFVHIPKINRDKLGPCAEKCVFVGYGIDQIGYRCYNPKTSQMFTTMNVDFLETKYFYDTQLSGQGENGCMDTLSWLTQLPSSEGVTTENHHITTSPSNTATQAAEQSTTEENPPNVIPEVTTTPQVEPKLEEVEPVIDHEVTAEPTEPTPQVKPELEEVPEWEKYNRPLSLVELKMATNDFDTKNKFLVYKYMSNGTLYQWIHSKPQVEGKKIGWTLRLRIAVGIAQGLAWLHHNNILPVAHLKIKSNCVLLDDKFVPKISNFGNPIILSANSTISSGCDFVVPQASVDPYKEDIYSFGILLFEIISGKERTSVESDTDSLVYNIFSDQCNMIDECLMEPGFKDEI